MQKVIDNAIKSMIQDIAIMRTMSSVKQDDGTHVRKVVNRNTGKEYSLEGQLVRNTKTGRFTKLSEVLA